MRWLVMNFYRHLCLLDIETPALGPLCRNHGPFLTWLGRPQLNRVSKVAWIEFFAALCPLVFNMLLVIITT